MRLSYVIVLILSITISVQANRSLAKTYTQTSSKSTSSSSTYPRVFRIISFSDSTVNDVLKQFYPPGKQLEIIEDDKGVLTITIDCRVILATPQGNTYQIKLSQNNDGPCNPIPQRPIIQYLSSLIRKEKFEFLKSPTTKNEPFVVSEPEIPGLESKKMTLLQISGIKIPQPEVPEDFKPSRWYQITYSSNSHQNAFIKEQKIQTRIYANKEYLYVDVCELCLINTNTLVSKCQAVKDRVDCSEDLKQLQSSVLEVYKDKNEVTHVLGFYNNDGYTLDSGFRQFFYLVEQKAAQGVSPIIKPALEVK